MGACCTRCARCAPLRRALTLFRSPAQRGGGTARTSMLLAALAAPEESEEEDEGPDTPQPMRWAKSFGHAIHDRLTDADGAVTRLYHYLWRKNAQGRTPAEFRIPDTARARAAARVLWRASRTGNGRLTRRRACALRAAADCVQVPPAGLLVLQLRAGRAGACAARARAALCADAPQPSRSAARR
jgi:hypothetical protein